VTKKAKSPYKKIALYSSILITWLATNVFLWTYFATSWHTLYSGPGRLLALIVTLFISVGWLYGFYHVFLLLFTIMRRDGIEDQNAPPIDSQCQARVAILHTVCNDFQHRALMSCVQQNHRNFHVYVLDDSSSEDIKSSIDDFASDHRHRITIIRRDNRNGFKAGNINHALPRLLDSCDYVALADSDTILPVDFLSKSCRLLEENSTLAFTQAVHIANPSFQSEFAESLGEMVRVGWKYYQPIRNKYGIPMCYGHGALIRSDTIRRVGGFPEIVSEDIAFTLRLRRLGHHGFFITDAICGEDYPSDYYTFRKRLSRWIAADLECFKCEMIPFLRAKDILLVEKLDALFRGLKVPFSAAFLPSCLAGGLIPFIIPEWELLDNFPILIITILTSLAPYYCFVVEMFRCPKSLWKTTSGLTTVYLSSTVLYCFRSIEAIVSRRAYFHVSGSRYDKITGNNFASKLFTVDQTGYPFMSILESIAAIVFLALGIYGHNLALLGVSFALFMSPIIYGLGWNSRLVSASVHVPPVLLIASLLLSPFTGLPVTMQCLVLVWLAVLLF